MTRSPSLFDPAQTDGERPRAFAGAAAPEPKRKRRRRRKSAGPRIPPLSIRLSVEERADLEARAGDVPVSTYAKSLLFAVTAKPARLSPRNPTLDHQVIGQLLGTLGRAEIAPHLRELAEAARSGSLPLDEITTAQLHKACHDVALMRAELMRALGVGDR
ncbi:hypothetical protein ABWH92_10280 [Ahrensia marina]|uniref:hypothetical protein n=1 Tax=Ahrensia marina TaxID=1514904 RepID=UPI0035D076E9